MNRWKFIASMFGFGALAEAQDAVRGVGQLPKMYTEEEVRGVGHGGPEWQGGKARNNQCPNCGTMAAKYTGEKDRNQCHDLRDAYLKFDHKAKTEDYPCDGPRQNLTRCHRCNNAFFQDAEK